MTGLISIPVALVALTVIAMIVRPRGLSEATIATIGAAIILTSHSVAFNRLPHLVAELSDVMLFLAGMMILTGIAERARVFELIAYRFVPLARGRGIRLFILVYLLGAGITATLSLDVTVIVLTPIVLSIVSRRNINALPFAFACVFVANIASLVLPVSNLTNLLMYDGLDLDFVDFLIVMFLPNLVAGAINIATLLWIFRKHVPFAFPDDPETFGRISPWTWVAGAFLGVTLASILVLGALDLPIWWGAMGGASLLLVASVMRREETLSQIMADVLPSIFLFVLGMAILVEAFREAWLNHQSITVPGSVLGSLATSIGISGLGSNVVNNIPISVLAIGIIQDAPAPLHEALTYGTLVGANIGPALTTYGSLATMLWLTQLRRRGIDVSTKAYMKVSLLAVPPVLVGTAITLWIVLLLRGTLR